MPEDTPQGEEQPTMLSFTEAAERLVEDRIAPNMTAEGLRRLARDPKSGWPIGPGDYRVVGKTRTLPYDVLAEYMRERLGKRRGRGPDTKKRGKRTQQQGDPVITTDTPANGASPRRRSTRSSVPSSTTSTTTSTRATSAARKTASTTTPSWSLRLPRCWTRSPGRRRRSPDGPYRRQARAERPLRD